MPTGVNEAIKNIQSNQFFPLSEMAHYPNLSGSVVKGTCFQPTPFPLPPPLPRLTPNLPATHVVGRLAVLS
jgi:hypothetical protein